MRLKPGALNAAVPHYPSRNRGSPPLSPNRACRFPRTEDNRPGRSRCSPQYSAPFDRTCRFNSYAPPERPVSTL